MDGMDEWKNFLKADPAEWLLEKDNPSARYFTLTEIMGLADDEPDVMRTREAIMKIGPVPKILARQKSGGHWGKPDDFYIRSKYRGTVWQLIVLAELGADASDERVRKACDFVLENSQDRESGGFAYVRSGSRGGRHDAVLPCLTGNMVWSLIRLGYLDDARVERGIDWIVKYQRFDDGDGLAMKGWPYDRHVDCWGNHVCHMGVVKTLKALAEVPSNKRTQNVRETIEKGAEYMLVHRIYKRSHNLSEVSKPEWLRFGFPNMWNTDVLEVIGILTKLGCRDERMRDAIDLVLSKQDSEGRWKLEKTFNGRFLVSIEQRGEPSKWITLNALNVVKQFCS